MYRRNRIQRQCSCERIAVKGKRQWRIPTPTPGSRCSSSSCFLSFSATLPSSSRKGGGRVHYFLYWYQQHLSLISCNVLVLKKRLGNKCEEFRKMCFQKRWGKSQAPPLSDMCKWEGCTTRRHNGQVPSHLVDCHTKPTLQIQVKIISKVKSEIGGKNAERLRQCWQAETSSQSTRQASQKMWPHDSSTGVVSTSRQIAHSASTGADSPSTRATSASTRGIFSGSSLPYGRRLRVSAFKATYANFAVLLYSNSVTATQYIYIYI